MLTIQKMTQIITEKDPEKQKAMIDALTDKERAALLAEKDKILKAAEKVRKTGEELRKK